MKASELKEIIESAELEKRYELPIIYQDWLYQQDKEGFALVTKDTFKQVVRYILTGECDGLMVDIKDNAGCDITNIIAIRKGFIYPEEWR